MFLITNPAAGTKSPAAIGEIARGAISIKAMADIQTTGEPIKGVAGIQARPSWRDVLPVHPAADLFPMMSEDELKALGEDIKKNGMTTPITVLAELKYVDGRSGWEYSLLDGRNRLAALEAVGIDPVCRRKPARGVRHCGLLSDLGIKSQVDSAIRYESPVDPWVYVISANILRRHLTREQKRDVIAGLLKADPSKSDRQIAEQVKASPTTVGTVRAKMEEAGDVPNLDTRTDIRGREQPATKPKPAPQPDAREIIRIASAPTSPPDDVGFGGASRVEPADSLDFFPTAPQATRALMVHVLPHLGVRRFASANEPACGEGHMAEVLREFFAAVHAADIKDYGYGDSVVDFLDTDASADLPAADWYITNPPFKEKVLAFALRALDLARVGVALFVPLRYLEGVGRYEQLYRDNPPTCICPFVDRVPLHRGRWEPDGDTKTAYAWLVWVKGKSPRPPFWIPPGIMMHLALPDDKERFTTTPVIKKVHNPPSRRAIETANAVRLVGAVDDDNLDLPNFLRRGADNVPPFARRG